MNAEEAVKRLDEIQRGDKEAAHGEADDILLSYLRETIDGAAVAKAWQECAKRVGGFWYA